MPTHSRRPLAPHVQAAIAAGQAKMGVPTQGRTMAPHVHRAITAVKTSRPGAASTLQRSAKPEFDFEKIESLQITDNSCWAAALSYVLQALGARLDQRTVLNFYHEGGRVGLDIDGKLLSLLFRKYGVRDLKYKIITGKDLVMKLISYDTPVVVGLTDPFHYVVVLKSEDEEVTYYDPWDSCNHTVSDDEFYGMGPSEAVYIYKE